MPCHHADTIRTQLLLETLQHALIYNRSIYLVHVCVKIKGYCTATCSMKHFTVYIIEEINTILLWFQQLYTHSSQIVQFRCGRIN